MCAILEQCKYLREHNNMDKPIKKGEALSLFESLGHEMQRNNVRINKKLANIERILIVGMPLGFTVLGLILR